MTIQREKIFGKINKDLLAMSKVVFKQIQLIKEQLDGVNILNKEEEITQNELILDSFEVKIRRNVINAIVLYGPRASALRKIMSCYDIAIDLERIGDLALNIHEHLARVDFKGETFKHLYTKLSQLLSISETMTKNAIYSFSCEDIQLTQEAIELDDVVDNLFEEVRKELVELSSEQTLSPEQLVEVLAINSLSYNIERIADNATNMVEAAVYLIEGRNIQHQHNKNEQK